MEFQIPEYLKKYLENTQYRKPYENFTNNSTYYSQLNWLWINYLETVVRPCVAYAFDTVDGIHNSALSTATGSALLRGATRLISGETSFFVGNDESCKFLSDVWAPAINFDLFKTRAISFMLAGGSCVIKANKAADDKNTLSAFRIDRTLFSVNDAGDVTNAVFFIGLLSNMKNQESGLTYWLVEERGYDDKSNKFVQYKVFVRGGTANSPTLPSPYQVGIEFTDLPDNVRRELKRMGASKLNKRLPLPTFDGLGVWIMRRTAVNSCVPDAPLGDPLLYGCLDLLWSIDVVYSGSIIDVLNGKGIILVPKQFLQATLQRLEAAAPSGTKFNVTTAELRGYEHESFVYIQPSGIANDKLAPMSVQFDIRADQYGKMLELYERLAAVRAGFSPTSIFPYLTPDSSAKTAREVTAEENLTRASIKETHALITPVFNRALREILRQEGFAPDVRLQLSDYIGNKLESDQNIRENYTAHLIPHFEAVQRVNNISVAETYEYMEKIAEDIRKEQQFTEAGMSQFLSEAQNDNSKYAPQPPSDSFGGGGDENTGDG